MPRLLVLYKWTIDEKDIRIRPDDLSLDNSRAAAKISDFDRNAIEAAVAIVAQHGGTVEALTYGSDTVKKSLKDGLSRGIDKIYWVAEANADRSDARVIARVLAAAIRQLGPYDAILCGEGSSDLFNQQTAPRLAALLDLPCLSFVNKLDFSGTGVTAFRKLEDCTEQVRCELPVVISVRSDINKPRIPTLKQILSAAKKPSEQLQLAILGLDAEDMEPRAARRSVKGLVTVRKNMIFKDADAASCVSKLVVSLTQEGLV